MPQKIKLTQGQFTTVDTADYIWLSQWNWLAHWGGRSFYVVARIRKLNGHWQSLRMHRLILGLDIGNKLQGDHINHDTLDNRRINLRVATVQQNAFNRITTRGYSWDAQYGQYRASIKVDGKTINLHRHNTEAAAREEYLIAKKKYHTF